jgi:hypothetical protein
LEITFGNHSDPASADLDLPTAGLIYPAEVGTAKPQLISPAQTCVFTGSSCGFKPKPVFSQVQAADLSPDL